METKQQKSMSGCALPILIQGKAYESSDEYLTGAELKQLAGLPLSSELFLAISRPWSDELITNEQRVNLARPGIEQFFIKKKLKYSINSIEYETYKQYISVAEIRYQAGISDDENIYLQVEAGYEDELLNESLLIDLARPGKEIFYSKGVCFDIIVETIPHKWHKKKICYDDLVKIACGNNEKNGILYTIRYEDGPPTKCKG
jgi:hypothetical protein